MALLHEDVSEKILAAAIEVHRNLRPVLLESTYEACLIHELAARGVRVASQVALPVIYKGLPIDCAYRMDLIVEEKIVVEI